MHFLFILLSYLLVCYCGPVCTSDYPGGYYCLSSSQMAWCYGQSTPAIYGCNSPLACVCGYSTENPCAWPADTTPSCLGKAGEYLTPNGNVAPPNVSLPSESEDSDISDLFILSKCSNHLPLVLKFYPSKWKTQLRHLMTRAFYDDRTLYTPVSNDYQCSFHPPERNDKNPSQMWIGRPSKTTTVSVTPGITYRLPDRYLGLFFAYALDHYGLNPGMFIGLGAKESFFGAVYAEAADNNYFLVTNDNDHYNCYSPTKVGLCNDANLDGPFQVETGAMSSDVSVFGFRFYTRSLDVPKVDRVPRYVTDNELMVSTTFRSFHDTYTLHQERATVLSCLDFNFRHNLLWKMKKIGFYASYQKRTSRIARDSLEFAAAMYTYNRGIFDTQLISLLSNCGAEADPVIDCKFDGYGGHSTDIRSMCKLVDSVPENELYDYFITKDELTYFLDTLEYTYPYDHAKGFFDSIPWETIRNEANEAWQMLFEHRKSINGGATGISFRFDFRALLAVVRMRLPSAEVISGPSAQNFANYWGNDLNDDLFHEMNPANFPFSTCSLAGFFDEMCDGDEDMSSDSVSSDLCPNDPNKTEPGICGCGVKDTDSDGDGTPDCIDFCPNDPNKTEPGKCGCGKKETECEPSSGSSEETAICSGIDTDCVFSAMVCQQALGLCSCLFQLSSCDCVNEWISCLENKGCVDLKAFEANPRLTKIIDYVNACDK